MYRHLYLITLLSVFLFIRCVGDEKIPVNGITLNTTALSLGIGETETLETAVMPSYADNKTVKWKSDDETIAVVDANGKVTAKAQGLTIITATTIDGDYKATCTVVVNGMTMTTSEYEVLIYLGGYEEATIDWGDGKRETFILTGSGINDEFRHDYSKNTTTKIISIVGVNILLLNCENNQITSLDVSKYTKLRNLICSINKLTSLDISKNTALTILNCYYNQLISLDVSNNTALRSLNCMINQIMNLDVSNNSALTFLDCYYNRLTYLDVSKNTVLKWFGCGANQLTNLDVNNNTELTHFDCQYNQLTSLDVSNNINLADNDDNLAALNCFNNKMDAASLNSLFGTLHSNLGNKTILIGNNPGTTTCNKSVAEGKGWTVDTIRDF